MKNISDFIGSLSFFIVWIITVYLSFVYITLEWDFTQQTNYERFTQIIFIIAGGIFIWTKHNYEKAEERRLKSLNNKRNK